LSNINKTPLDELKDYFVEQPPLLRTPKTIQILLLRQTHDYTIFRTEETREINTVVIPKSINDSSQTTRVVFLASKQKASESRFFASFTKEYYSKILQKVPDEDVILMKCELKDALCKMCPRCVLFGAMNTDCSDRWSIKHRVEYSSAFSLEPYQLATEYMTFNAVNESTNSTERALGSMENIEPVVTFPSIITMNSPTKEEFILLLKTLLGCKSYGAEGRIKGDVLNYISGIVFGNEELLTSLEYCLELSEKIEIKNYLEITNEILKRYTNYSTFPDALKVLTTNEVSTLLEDVQKIDLSKKADNKNNTNEKENIILSAFSKSKKFAENVQNLMKT
jgi:CRISPR type I-D-associated protein Csc2